MKKDEELQRFVSAMPKVELHAHLNGCIREETLFALAKERNVTLSSTHFGHDPSSNSSTATTATTAITAATTAAATTAVIDDDLSVANMYNKKPRSLMDCFEMFAEIPKCVNDRASLERITREALEDFAAHHVVYLELRSTPKRLKDLTKKGYVETILSVMTDFEKQEEERYKLERQSSSSSSSLLLSADNNTLVRMPLKTRFIVSIDRSGSVQEAEENVDLAIELFQQSNSLVVGMDIGGNPMRNDVRNFLPSMSRARHAGLKLTIHCAEMPVGESNADNDPLRRKAFEEVDAIFQFQPDRLGHALLLSPALRSELMDRHKIPVETCPTSNVMTLDLAKHKSGNLIDGLQHHPQLPYWLDQKYPISICTDDPGVFHTSATQELLLLARAWMVAPRELERIVMASMEHSFCRAELRTSIREKLIEYFSFLHGSSVDLRCNTE